MILRALLLVALLGLCACSSKNSSSQSHDHQATEIANHECAACGMTVREQPSPRGQLVHRDGTREYFCSISDMLTYLDAPSPHGEAVKVYVEAVDGDSEPLALHTEERPWIEAAGASYVVGIEKKMVMGKPVLSYSSTELAEQSAKLLQATVVTWKKLNAAANE